MHITEQVKEYVQHAMKNKIRTYFFFYSIVGCGGVNLGVDLQGPFMYRTGKLVSC